MRVPLHTDKTIYFQPDRTVWQRLADWFWRREPNGTPNRPFDAAQIHEVIVRRNLDPNESMTINLKEGTYTAPQLKK